jgi:hypothetical protein
LVNIHKTEMNAIQCEIPAIYHLEGTVSSERLSRMLFAPAVLAQKLIRPWNRFADEDHD